jgi:prepilin-type N-terminal cleavage/methylation domain-containing protein
MKTGSLSRRQALGSGPTRNGFSLIEVVIAISVVAVAFIGIVGLLGVGVANNQSSSQQAVATNIAESILADLRSTPAYATTSTRYGLSLPTANAGSASAPLSGVSPSYYLYFDNSPSFLPLSAPTAYTAARNPVPSGAVYVAAVYMTRLSVAGPTSTLATTTPALLQSNDMVRVVVTWPAQATSSPSGSVDVIAQFLIR